LFSENRKPETENGIKGVLPLEAGTDKDSQAGPLTALFFLWLSWTKSCENLLKQS